MAVATIEQSADSRRAPRRRLRLATSAHVAGRPHPVVIHNLSLDLRRKLVQSMVFRRHEPVIVKQASTLGQQHLQETSFGS